MVDEPVDEVGLRGVHAVACEVADNVGESDDLEVSLLFDEHFEGEVGHLVAHQGERCLGEAACVEGQCQRSVYVSEKIYHN